MTKLEPEIRAFTPEDWGAVCDVHRAAARVELASAGIDPRAFRPMPDEEDVETFLHRNEALVAIVDERVVGFVAWRGRGEWRKSGYLSWLYVDPAYHRRGIGDVLMRRAMEALGPKAWTLVKEGNEPAINLYRKHGMRIVRSRPAETSVYPHTEVRMALPTSHKSDPYAPNFGA